MDILNYAPRASCRVQIGHVTLGADEPLRLQSMTTTPTDDVEASTAQAERLFAAGADIVRLTAQGMRQVEALKQIRQRLNADGFTGPLVADIHFNPDVADAAAAVVEKVRINPGNYVDPARTFQHKVYTDAEYRAELQRLEVRFTRLLDVCRQHHTALRIGVNHGSLSDRIMSRYGDTPEGIVESCMEFLRVCRKTGFSNVVVSVKASQTAVMVRSVRLLCAAMEKEGMRFPLHLGVTEAGEGEDGRIRSAVGIGALLADGIGDTLRVSLSEAPEAEVPVAYKLAAHVVRRAGHPFIYGRVSPDFSYTHPQRRPTRAVLNIGGGQAPVVIGERTDGAANEVGALPPDYLYTSRHLPDTPQPNCAYIVDADVWQPRPRTYPAFAPEHLMLLGMWPNDVPKFLFLTYPALNDEVRACLRQHPEIVIIAQSQHPNRLGELRALVNELWVEHIMNPVVMFEHYAFGAGQIENFQLAAAADSGALFIDGLADGLMLLDAAPDRPISHEVVDQTAFGILQAAGVRTTRTEYISCPGCGRTLYDLQATIARVKAATAHLTGLKIAIMGCIVNGPGEMADADYGYVGAARGRISLYRGRECVEKNIPEEEAVAHLLDLIRRDGRG